MTELENNPDVREKANGNCSSGRCTAKNPGPVATTESAMIHLRYLVRELVGPVVM